MQARAAEIVTIDSGKLRGNRCGGVVEFRGVPYGAPPTGFRRFAPPEPIAKWATFRDATRDGPISPQTRSRVFVSMGEITSPQAEDCLTLTIWQPANQQGGRYPVVVWFHGGGFVSGGGSLPWYDGARLAESGNLIVVNVNYRLGALGFLSIPEILPGNLGILDQEAALRWVQSNIAAFNGDPSNVTVMGQSGGAHNIASLLTMKRTEGLFRRAILQSPPLGIGLQTAAEANLLADVFLEPLGLRRESPDLVNRLREVSIDKILAAQALTMQRLGRISEGDLRPPFRPTSLEPHTPCDMQFADCAATAAAERGTEIMVGWTQEEANLFYPPDDAVRAMRRDEFDAAATRVAGDAAVDLIATILRRRATGSPGTWFIDMVSECSFRLPCLRMAERILRAGGTVYAYQFDWATPDPALGACHCADLPFVFGTYPVWACAPILHGADTKQMAALSQEMMKRWTDFATTGNPGFQAWTESARPIMHFDQASWLEHYC